MQEGLCTKALGMLQAAFLLFLGQVFYAPPAGRKAKALLHAAKLHHVFFYEEATIPWRIVSKAHYGKEYFFLKVRLIKQKPNRSKSENYHQY